jgi:cysteine desulfurase / selenocysteine lyase
MVDFCDEPRETARTALDTNAWCADEPPAPCRHLFPMTQDSVYLDTGSSGLSFRGLGAAAAAFYDNAKILGYPGRFQWQAKAASVRRRLAEMLAIDENEIEFFSGTTASLNLVACGLDWHPGDEIVVAADEFPTVRLSWQAAERAGATIRLIEIPSEAERTATLEAAVNERTRVLVAAHVHSNTGTRVDLDRLGQACRQHDALFVVDGIHALGAMPVDLTYVDIYAAGTFKWLLAGFGVAVFVCRERAAKVLKPGFRGYLNEQAPHGLQFAHANYPGLYALDASLELLGETIGWDLVHARTAQLVQWLADDLAEGGIELVSPPGARAGLACFPVPDSEGLRDRLAVHRIYAAAKGSCLRATPFFYNSRQDIRAFAAEVLRDLS